VRPAASELGARFDRLPALHANAVLALRGRLAWAHDWVSDSTLTPLFQLALIQPHWNLR
jgi:uncharacterized protein with beta-barrel porin domain